MSHTRRIAKTAVLVGLILVVTAASAGAYTVTLTANPTTLTEPGGTVQYTFTHQCVTSLLCHNHGVSDSFGPIAGQGDCTVGGLGEFPIAEVGNGSGSYTCTYSRPVNGVAGDTITNTVTVFDPVDIGDPDCSDHSCERTASAQVTIQAAPSGGGGGGGGGSGSPCALSNVEASVRSISGCVDRRIGTQFTRQNLRNNRIRINTGGGPNVPDPNDFEDPDGDVPSVNEIESEVMDKLKGLD